MKFFCQDLREHGVVLIPPSSREYDGLLADIQRRLDHAVEGSPPQFERQNRITKADRQASAILVNISEVGIAAIQQVRRYRRISLPGPDYKAAEYVSSVGPGARDSSVLLPYGWPQDSFTRHGYWHVILPGSKRYVSPGGQLIGNNTDVRLPVGAEIWTGGAFGFTGPFVSSDHTDIETLTFTLDGVFFTDGTFAGPNTRGLFEQVTEAAEAHQRVVAIAKRGQERGDATSRILAEIETIAPASERFPHPPAPALIHLGFTISRQRSRAGDEQTLQTILSWAETKIPNFRKL